MAYVMFCALALGVLAASWTDVRRGIAPNGITLPLLLGGLALHGVAGMLEAGTSGGLTALGQALAGVFVAFAPMATLFALGGIGGGDVKLMAGIGAFLAWPALVVEALVVTLVLAVVMALGLMVRHGIVRRTGRRLLSAMIGRLTGSGAGTLPQASPRVPLAVAMAAAALLIAGREWLGWARLWPGLV